MSHSFLFAMGAQEAIPPLRPPRPELQPTFWEQHGWKVSLAIFLVLVVAMALITRRRRSKPAISERPEAITRSALQALRGRPEDVQLVVEISRILRRYIIAAFSLPPDELTTGELEKTLKQYSGATSESRDVGAPREEPGSDGPAQVSPELVGRIIGFLRYCDEWKFAPAPSSPGPELDQSSSTGSLDRATELVNQIETSRKVKTPTIQPQPSG